MFDYDKIMKPKTIVHCSTKEKANQLLNWAHEQGLKWCDGDSYLNINKWYVYEANTCYSLCRGSFGNLRAIQNNENIIYSFEEVVLKEKVKNQKRKVKHLKENKDKDKFILKVLNLLETDNEFKQIVKKLINWKNDEF